MYLERERREGGERGERREGGERERREERRKREKSKEGIMVRERVTVC